MVRRINLKSLGIEVTPLTPIEVSEFFANIAQDLCKEQDAQKVLAAVLATVYGEQLSPKHYGRISVQKDFGKQDDMSRIYVQLGKKDGLRPKDIAEFFSNMLHIPGRQVDQIDMTREFTLVSLPKASARKAIELSKNNKKIPHMHYDVKDGMSRRQKAEDSKQRRKNSSEKKNASDFVKNKDSNKKFESRKESRSKGNRPNVHVQTEQRKGAAKYKKSSKAERF